MTPVIWLLGLSGSGKTTLGSLLRLHLEAEGHDVAFIDADRFRRQNGITGFTPEARTRNINAIRAHVLQQLAQDRLCIVTAITPYAEMRMKNREQIPLYREVWVRCGMKTLAERDTKGFYARAARGEMELLSGVSDAFDEPASADLVIDTDRMTMADSYVALRDLAEDAVRESEEWEDLGYDLAIPTVHTQVIRGYLV